MSAAITDQLVPLEKVVVGVLVARLALSDKDMRAKVGRLFDMSEEQTLELEEALGDFVGNANLFFFQGLN